MLLEVKKGGQLSFCYDIKIKWGRIYLWHSLPQTVYYKESLVHKEHFYVKMTMLYPDMEVERIFVCLNYKCCPYCVVLNTIRNASSKLVF